jgi:hypothetical protein
MKMLLEEKWKYIVCGWWVVQSVAGFSRGKGRTKKIRRGWGVTRLGVPKIFITHLSLQLFFPSKDYSFPHSLALYSHLGNCSCCCWPCTLAASAAFLLHLNSPSFTHLPESELVSSVIDFHGKMMHATDPRTAAMYKECINSGA